MIFLTVGTEYPFDRLTRAVDGLIADGRVFDEIFAQIGNGKYQPKHMQWASVLSREKFDVTLQESSAVISHAGMGTILRCLELRKPLLVVPRRMEYSEHVSDHQMSTARKLSAREDLLIAHDISDLGAKVEELRDFRPPQFSSEARALIEHVRGFLKICEGTING